MSDDIDPQDASSGDLGLGLIKTLRDLLDSVLALQNPDQASSALRMSGWDPELLGISDTVAGAAKALADAMKPVQDMVDLQRKPTLAQLGEHLIASAPGMADLADTIDSWTPPAGAPASTGAVLTADLLQGLLLRSLVVRYPKVALALVVSGGLRQEAVGELRLDDGRLLRAANTRPALDLGAFSEFLTDPIGALGHRFVDDGGGRRAAEAIITELANAVADPLMLAGVTVRHPVPAEQSPQFAGLDVQGRLIGLEIPFADATSKIPGRLRVLFGVTEATGGEGVGLVLGADGQLSAVVRLPRGSLTGRLAARTDPILLTPKGIRFALPGSIGAPNVIVGLDYDSGQPVPFLRLGTEDSTHFDVNRITAQVGSAFDGEQAELLAAVQITGMRLVIRAGDGDGFLATALGDRAIEGTFDLGVAWSSIRGLTFSGSAGLEIEIPIALELGPLRIETVWLSLRVLADGDTPKIVTELAVSLAFGLGPFAASVSRLGLAGRLSLTGGSGKASNLGFAALDLGIKPPSGAGLAIDLPAVSGGGFLFFDPDAGQYAGVFELTIVGTVSVKAVAIISTKLPDGQPGFALLIVITAEGFTPVQLGFGFTLTGIGGLLALNRTIEVDVVRNGLRDGVLDSVLFVKDPVKNASRIISTLNRVFPIAPGRLVDRPACRDQLGHAPTGQDQAGVAAGAAAAGSDHHLGRSWRSCCRDAKAPVVELHVDSIGVLDFGRGELALDASHPRLATAEVRAER